MFSQASVCPQRGRVHLGCNPPPSEKRRSTGGRYASHWNAFLFYFTFIPLLRPQRWNSHSPCPHPQNDWQTNWKHILRHSVGGRQLNTGWFFAVKTISNIVYCDLNDQPLNCYILSSIFQRITNELKKFTPFLDPLQKSFPTTQKMVQAFVCVQMRLVPVAWSNHVFLKNIPLKCVSSFITLRRSNTCFYWMKNKMYLLYITHRSDVQLFLSQWNKTMMYNFLQPIRRQLSWLSRDHDVQLF